MDDKTQVIFCVTVISLIMVGLSCNSEGRIDPKVIELVEKVCMGLFGIATGTGIGFAIGSKKKDTAKTKISKST